MDSSARLKRLVVPVVLVTAALVLTSLGTAWAYLPASVETFGTQPVLAATQTPGAWYPDRKAPAAFESAIFDGDRRLHLGIDGSQHDAGNNFYNTQGRKFDVETGDGTSMQGDLYVGPDWGANDRRSDMWATAFDDSGTVTAFPVIGFLTGTGFRVWTNSGWQTIGFPAGFTYGRWYTLRCDLTADGFKYYIDGTLVYVDTDTGGSTHLGNVIDPGLQLGCELRRLLGQRLARSKGQGRDDRTFGLDRAAAPASVHRGHAARDRVRGGGRSHGVHRGALRERQGRRQAAAARHSDAHGLDARRRDLHGPLRRVRPGHPHRGVLGDGRLVQVVHGHVDVHRRAIGRGGTIETG